MDCCMVLSENVFVTFESGRGKIRSHMTRHSVAETSRSSQKSSNIEDFGDPRKA